MRVDEQRLCVGTKRWLPSSSEYKWESIPSRDHSSANFLQRGRLIMLEFVLYDNVFKLSGVDADVFLDKVKTQLGFHDVEYGLGGYRTGNILHYYFMHDIYLTLLHMLGYWRMEFTTRNAINGERAPLDRFEKWDAPPNQMHAVYEGYLNDPLDVDASPAWREFHPIF